MITGTATNYTGRKKDISILHEPDGLLSGTQPVSIGFGKRAKYCAGVQKLMQRYAVILLTNLNSQTNYPAFGTDFLYTMRAGVSAVDNLRATQVFNLASYDAVNALQEYQATREDIPADERLVSATLSNISIIADVASFDVSIKTEAGDDLAFLIPLPK